MNEDSKQPHTLETTNNETENIHTMFDRLKVINSRFISTDEVSELSSSLILQNFDSKSSEKIEGSSEAKHLEDIRYNSKTQSVKKVSENIGSSEVNKGNIRMHEVEYSFSLEPNSLVEKENSYTQSLMDITVKEDSDVYLQLIYKLFSELNNKISKIDKSKLLGRLLVENKMGNHKEVQTILEEEFLDTENLLKKVCKTNLIQKLNNLELNINEYKDKQETLLNDLKDIVTTKVNEILKLKEEKDFYKNFVNILNKEGILEATFMHEYLKEDSKLNNKSLKTENENLCKLVSEINLENEILTEKYKMELNKNKDLEKKLLKFQSELYKLQVRYKKKTEIIEKQKKVLNVLTTKLSNI